MPDIIEGEPIPHDLLNTIVPNNRKKAEATLVSKAADTAKMGAAIGPWIVTNREAGTFLSLFCFTMAHEMLMRSVAKPKVEQFVQAVRADPKTCVLLSPCVVQADSVAGASSAPSDSAGEAGTPCSWHRKTARPRWTWSSPTTPVRLVFFSQPKSLPIYMLVSVLTVAAFLSNDDVKPIKSVPVAIFKGSNDDMMDQKALDEVSQASCPRPSLVIFLGEQ